MIQIQPLEARQLLSASLHTSKPKPTLPNMVGVFHGTETEQKPTAGAPVTLSVTITSESTKGVLAGSVVAGGSTSETLTGHVNTKGHVAVKFPTPNNSKVTVTGTYDASTHVFSGKYSASASKGHKAAHGVFSVTLVS